MARPSQEDDCWPEVAVNAACVVDEAQPLKHAAQHVAHSALCGGGCLEKLAHVGLVQVEHEPNVGLLAVAEKPMWWLHEEAHVD